MSNYIQIWCNDHSTSISVSDLIAFLPNEGYIIFTGYSYLKKEKLPHRIEFHRNQPDCNLSVQLIAEITDVFKKDIQSISYIEKYQK